MVRCHTNMCFKSEFSVIVPARICGSSVRIGLWYSDIVERRHSGNARRCPKLPNTAPLANGVFGGAGAWDRRGVRRPVAAEGAACQRPL